MHLFALFRVHFILLAESENIFRNLNYAVQDLSLRLYTDDTTLCIRCLAHCPTICCEPGSQPPVGVVQGNYLLINNAKTQALSIGPCKYDFDLTLNGSGVTKLPSLRILGVELDGMLNFMEHNYF